MYLLPSSPKWFLTGSSYSWEDWRALLVEQVRHQNRASNMEIIVCNLPSQVTFHHFSHILFIKRKSLSSTHTHVKESTQGHKYQKMIIGNLSNHCLSHSAQARCSMTDSRWQQKKCIIINSRRIQNHRIGEDLTHVVHPKCCAFKSDISIKYNVMCQKLCGFVKKNTMIRPDIMKHLILEGILNFI